MYDCSCPYIRWTAVWWPELLQKWLVSWRNHHLLRRWNTVLSTLSYFLNPRVVFHHLTTEFLIHYQPISTITHNEGNMSSEFSFSDSWIILHRCCSRFLSGTWRGSASAGRRELVGRRRNLRSKGVSLVSSKFKSWQEGTNHVKSSKTLKRGQPSSQFSKQGMILCSSCMKELEIGCMLTMLSGPNSECDLLFTPEPESVPWSHLMWVITIRVQSWYHLR